MYVFMQVINYSVGIKYNMYVCMQVFKYSVGMKYNMYVCMQVTKELRSKRWVELNRYAASVYSIQ